MLRGPQSTRLMQAEGCAQRALTSCDDSSSRHHLDVPTDTLRQALLDNHEQ
jgi:hypothetical protein